jgi:two-component system, LytTR family, response regulator
MLKTIIVDDEPFAIENLKTSLEKLKANIEIVATANNIEDALVLIYELKPDLLFSDIEMPGGTGLDLMKHLKPIDIEVIFVTAYDHFALQAIKNDALDYILKPINKIELLEAVEKAKKKIHAKKSIKKVGQSEDAVEYANPTATNSSKLALPSSEGLIFVPFADIMYCESDSRYSYFHTKQGKKYLVTKTLGDFEPMLTENQFVRIHNKYIVNIAHITKYIRGRGGIVVLENGVHLDVSERRREDFLKLFEN